MKTRHQQADYNQAHTQTGEQALWCAVIEQAWDDATMTIHRRVVKKGQRGNKSGESMAAQTEARRWFSENSEDFRLVCEFAGMDPTHVRRKAKTMLGIKGIN